MRIYLAAPWSHRDKARAAAKRFEDAGHAITEPWWDHPETDEHEELVRQCYRDITGVLSSDIVVVLQLAPSEGKAVETGIALACRIPIVVVNTERTPANLFQHLCASVASMDEALVVVAALNKKSTYKDKS